MRDVKKLDVSKSALAHHISENLDHKFYFDSASLVEVEERYWHIKFKENLYIQKNEESN
jgi:hypothetical protein